MSKKKSESQVIRAYHGNQGGIDTERLHAPMWFTTSREDAEYYAGDDGYVVVADLDILNPYVIASDEEPNTVLRAWRDLQAQGYDGIHDPGVGDWIPFSNNQIKVVSKDDVMKENFADGKVKGKREIEKKLAEDLRAWFGKGKQGGAGGGGWDRYNTKGERIGKCGEKKPGEGKPKCLSKSKASSLRASGGKKAIAAAVNKKRREDPNPNRKGSADMVSNKVKKTNESKLFESEQRMKKAYIELSKELLNPNTNDIRREAIQRQIIELQQLAKRFGINLQKDSLQTFVENFECPHCHGLMYSESMITEEGKKDACYHKVKSRYKIWPSAYASGALVKCRKAGASNWGNKSKKNEDVEKDEEDSNIPGLTYKEIFGVGKPRVENLPFGQVTHRTTLRTPADAKILFVKRLMQKYDLDQRKATDIMKAVEYDVAKGATWDWAVENQLNIFNIADPFAGEREQEYNADQDRVRQQTVKTLKNFYKLVKQKQGQERAQAIARLRQIWNQGTPEEQAEADRMFGDDPQWQQIKSKLVMKPQSTNVELDESLKNKLAAAGVAATMALSPAHARVTDGGQSFAQQTAQQSSQHQSVKIPKQIPSKSYLQNVASGKSRSLMDPDTAKELLKKYYK